MLRCGQTPTRSNVKPPDRFDQARRGERFGPTSENLVRGFAEPLGYTCATTVTVVELNLVSADISPVQPPDGYTVATYLIAVPDHQRAIALIC